MPPSIDDGGGCDSPAVPPSLGRYTLKALINHQGESLEEGHYFALSQRLDGKWWLCNDSDIRCLSAEEEAAEGGEIERIIGSWQKKVYLLMY